MSFFLLQTELRKVLVSKEEDMKRLLTGLGTGAVISKEEEMKRLLAGLGTGAITSKKEEMKRLLAGVGTGAVHTNSAAIDAKKRKIENLDQVNRVVCGD